MVLSIGSHITIDAIGNVDDAIRFAVDGGGLFSLLSLDVLETDDEENGGTLTASNAPVIKIQDIHQSVHFKPCHSTRK